MNKKFLSVALFGALLATTTGTFTSCKDYDDDIKGLQEQIDKKGSCDGDYCKPAQNFGVCFRCR